MDAGNFDDYSETFFNTLHQGHDFDEIAKGFKLYYYNCLPRDKSASILDVGCGAGNFLRFLELEQYANIEGIELSPQQAEITRKRISGTIHVGDVADLLAKSGKKYTLITLNDVLEHIPKNEIVHFLKTLRDGLAPNGALVVNVPQVAGLTTAYNRYNDFTHNVIFTEMSLRQVLAMAGFFDIRFIREKWPFKLGFRHIAYRLARWCWYKLLTLAYIIEMPGESKPHSLQIRLVAVAKQESKNK